VTRAATLPLLIATLVALSACSSPPGPARYRVLVTEPSGNIDSNERLFAHWSCDPAVDPATRYRGQQTALWTDVEGAPAQGLLQTSAACPSGALLTVQVDAGVSGTRPTELRCEVFNEAGERVADERVTRGLGSVDPVCRVPVP
jgi:hypothetical protein